MCLIDLTKFYDSVNRILLWSVLSRFGVPQRMIAVKPQFHDGIRASVRLDDGECSYMFDAERGLGHGRVNAPLLFNMFFAVVLCVAEKLFTADTAWCTSNEWRGKRKIRGEGYGLANPTGRERKRTPMRCGECCSLTMKQLYRGHQEVWRG